MPAKVKLTVTQGRLDGQEFLFDEPNSCILGRAADCLPRLPDDEAHKTVSRHHCLLDINPPDIRVRDFGSKNGTFVNEEKIGQRPPGTSPEQGAALRLPERDLEHGDVLRVGHTTFKVEVLPAEYCATCGEEIDGEKRKGSRVLKGLLMCEECQRQPKDLVVRPAGPKVCALCGRDVSAEMGQHRQGEYVCATCQRDPMRIMLGMLAKARSGEHKLQAVDGYVIERELGRGGMGAVYLARHEATGKQVALKVMLPRVAASAKGVQSFLREVTNTQALKHRNIVEFRESGCADGTFFFTLEYCSGGSVDQLMQLRGGTLPRDEALAIIFDVLDGLAYAHGARIPNVKMKDGRCAEGKGLVHRDLSPHNILLQESGGKRVAKITDYGLAKAFDLAGLSGQTRTGVTAGKPFFMPRQQVVNYKLAHPGMDLWAAAACLYNMLTGRYPRSFPPSKDPWQVVLESDPDPIRLHAPHLSQRLAAVIDQALMDKQEIVYKSATELKADLKAAL